MFEVFTKYFPSAEARREAVSNHAWLSVAATTLTMPAISRNEGNWIEFERIEGRHLEPADLPAYARHLGQAHAAAWDAQLRHARLEKAYESENGTVIRDFITPRIHLAEPPELHALAAGPAAFYKDANLRNTLVTDAGVLVTVDFDSLTLAPFGYDLAKCAVSLTMTYGQLPDAALRLAWARYNAAAAAPGRPISVEWPAFLAMADLNARLTTPISGGTATPTPGAAPPSTLREPDDHH